MLPVPYNADAPLYHWPIATVGIILLNIVLYFTVPLRMYYPLEHPFLDVEARHQALAEKERERKEAGEKADPDAPIEDGDVPNLKWAEDDEEWEQVEFDDPANQKDGIAFQVVELNRDGASQFPGNTLTLQHGKFRPWQWFTSMFMHHDMIHLVFNMFALWAFGLVIEGKVGTLVFLGLYLVMGAAQAGFEQTLMLFSSNGGGSIGSTGAILAALGIAVIWAPSNEFDCFWAYGFRFGTVEIPIMMYGFVILIAHTLSGLVLSYFSLTPIFQLIGLPIGIGVGFLWLQSKWVDCEGWDIINVWKGNEGNIDQNVEMDDEAFKLVRSSLKASGKEKPDAEPAYFAPQPTPMGEAPDANQFDGFFNSLNSVTSPSSPGVAPPPLIESLMEVMKLIERNEFAFAGQMYQRTKVLQPDQVLTQPKLDRLMRGLLAEKQYELSIPLMVEHAKRFPENRIAIQLSLAKVLIHLQRPTKAIAALRGVDRSGLDEAQKTTFQKLATHAKKLIDDGVIEFQ
jgi:membrane associated rhomboid family serine protease